MEQEVVAVTPAAILGTVSYPSDPGAHFDSDVHRRVLGHLSLPTDKFGWNLVALYERLKDSAGVAFAEAHDELQKVLDELVSAGHAEKVGEVYRQTQQGFDALQAEVPESAQGPAGPATISAATPIGEPTPEAPGVATPAQIVPDSTPPVAAAQEVPGV